MERHPACIRPFSGHYSGLYAPSGAGGRIAGSDCGDAWPAQLMWSRGGPSVLTGGAFERPLRVPTWVTPAPSLYLPPQETSGRGGRQARERADFSFSMDSVDVIGRLAATGMPPCHGGDRGFERERGRMTQQWDFPVDEPVSLSAYRRHRLAESVTVIAERLGAGTSLRALAHEYGVSREAVRRVLAHPVVVVDRAKPMQSDLPQRRGRAHRRPGRGRSRIFTPAEVAALLV